MDNYQLNEILQFLKDKTPMIYDMELENIKYDKKSMYYKAYKCIYDLKEENKKLKEKIKGE